MPQIFAETELISTNGKEPSLLRQIVDAADSLDEQGKAEVLKNKITEGIATGKTGR